LPKFASLSKDILSASHVWAAVRGVQRLRYPDVKWADWSGDGQPALFAGGDGSGKAAPHQQTRL